MEIETARLLLRGLTVDDVEAYQRVVASDPEVMRFLPGGEPLSVEATQARIRLWTEQGAKQGFTVWGVVVRETGALIGHCGLALLDEGPEVELAYALARAEWGKGFALEAAQAALRYGFEVAALPSIVARAVAANHGSERVMQKLGMRFERRYFDHGTELVGYRMMREDFGLGDAPFRVVADDGEGEARR